MPNLATPDSIIAELVSIRAEAQKGLDAQATAERRLAEATLALDTAEAKAFLGSEGTVSDRQAHTKILTTVERFEEAIAKVELNRIKTKMRILEQAQMSVQTQARLVELMYRSAGMGER